jgi:hypothetical protein
VYKKQWRFKLDLSNLSDPSVIRRSKKLPASLWSLTVIMSFAALMVLSASQTKERRSTCGRVEHVRLSTSIDAYPKQVSVPTSVIEKYKLMVKK